MQLLGEAANNIELPDIPDDWSKSTALEGKTSLITTPSASPHRYVKLQTLVPT
jgi:hypothetical protein